MAQIVITAIGSAGDVHPFLAIGRTLMQRGHRVVFCTHPPFAPLVEAEGFAFVPIGTAQEYEEALANPALWNPRTSFRVLWKVIAPSIRPHVDALSSLLTDDTVMLGSLWAFAARIVQEVHGTPYVSVQVSPSTLLSGHSPPTHKRFTVPMWLPLQVRIASMRLIEKAVLDPALGPALNGVRTEIGLAPARRILGKWLHSPDGVLCLFPDWFAKPQPDWPANRFLCGFPLPVEPSATPLDDDLADFLSSGAPPVVFTAGSTLIDEAAYFGAVEETLRLTGARAIVLTRSQPASLLANPGVRVRPFVPMHTLLPRCAAIVHHGGIGTAALAFASGIPQVVTPFAHDQFDNAARIEKTGCGGRIDGPVNGRAIATALRHVTRDTGVAAQCVIARQRIVAEPNACVAASQYIERFVPSVPAVAELESSA
ncbi:glycosyl transferase family 1 [Paraburkholderia acidicola]|uniref:Glycosyl transferase family 1 n=1 Tax=Paraburkholderia acidicola TaxID=1912599 RepID=A0A2A4EPC4_9BURK|nr:nucleotide disphospho-sugar-binding domain-containing protein [Paraburkholderia acidicola]PCE22282.1 glycosyl transferase family 1 [Paraburkholderia acidicola]